MSDDTRRWYVLAADNKVQGPLSMTEYMEHIAANGDNFIVAKTQIGEVEVSTVFLRLDHNHGYSDRPILFETMIFGGEWGDYQWRYCTLVQAEAGHERIVAALNAGENLGEIEVV